MLPDHDVSASIALVDSRPIVGGAWVKGDGRDPHEHLHRLALVAQEVVGLGECEAGHSRVLSATARRTASVCLALASWTRLERSQGLQRVVQMLPESRCFTPFDPLHESSIDASPIRPVA